MTTYKTVEINSLEDMENFVGFCSKTVQCCQDRVSELESHLDKLFGNLEYREFSNDGDDTLAQFIRLEKSRFESEKDRYNAVLAEIEKDLGKDMAHILESGPLQ